MGSTRQKTLQGCSCLVLLAWPGWAGRATHDQLGASWRQWRGLYAVDARQQLLHRIPALGGEIEPKGRERRRVVRSFRSVVDSRHAHVVRYTVAALVEGEDDTERSMIVGCDKRRRGSSSGSDAIAS